MSKIWDTIVIGGSAAGLSAALMLGRSRRSTLVIDNQKPRNRFADHMHGVLGHEGRPPQDLINNGREEAAQYGVEFLDGTVSSVTEDNENLTVTTDSSVQKARTIIVATGITDQLPDIKGIEERWGKTILHCPYCHGYEFKDRKIGVLAMNPMALHQVHLVRQLTDDVTLFAANAGPLTEADISKLEAQNINIVMDEVQEISGLATAHTANSKTELDAIFTATTLIPHDTFLKDLNLKRHDAPMNIGSFLAVDQMGKTSHERIWAAGNVVNPMANVPISMSAGTQAGAVVNAALVEMDIQAKLLTSNKTL